jgi:hypothetical protein
LRPPNQRFGRRSKHAEFTDRFMPHPFSPVNRGDYSQIHIDGPLLKQNTQAGPKIQPPLRYSTASFSNYRCNSDPADPVTYDTSLQS